MQDTTFFHRLALVEIYILSECSLLEARQTIALVGTDNNYQTSNNREKIHKTLFHALKPDLETDTDFIYVLIRCHVMAQYQRRSFHRLTSRIKLISNSSRTVQ